MALVKPTENDFDWLASRVMWVERFLLQRYPTASLNQSMQDLAWLQRALDEKALRPEHTAELQAFGLVFGRVLLNAVSGLDWAVAENELERYPVLRFNNTTLQINVLTLVSKRIERGVTVDLRSMLAFFVGEIERLCDQVD